MLDMYKLKLTAQDGLGTSYDVSEAIPVGNELSPVCAYFSYYHHPRERDLGEPESLRYVDTRTNTRIGSTAFVMEDWKIPRAKDPYRAGKYPGARGKSAHELAGLWEAFERAQQHTIPQFFRGVTALETQTERIMAGFLSDHWEEATEVGFMKYYKAVGADWFAWLNRVRAE